MSLLVALLVASPLCAQAQINKAIVEELIPGLNSRVPSPVDYLTMKDFKAVLSSNANLSKQWAETYCVEVADVKFHDFAYLVPTLDNKSFVAYEAQRVQLNAVYLDLGKLRPNEPDAQGVHIMIMARDPRTNNPLYIKSYKLEDEMNGGAVAKNASPVAPANGNTTPTTTATTTNTGNVPPGATQLADGTIIGQGYMVTPQGVTMIQQPNGTYLSAAQIQAGATTSAQGAGQSGQTQQAKADSTTRTYALNVTESGDAGVLASLGGGQQQGQGNGATTDPAIPQKGWEKINFDGAERIMVYTPNGPFMLPKEQAPPQDQVEIIRPGRRGVIINHGADGEATVMTPVTEQAVMAMIRRLYNLPEQAPTSGSASAVASRNGIGYGYPAAGAYYQQVGLSYGVGVYGGVQIGVGGGNCGGCGNRDQHVVQSAGAISGNGPNGFAQFQQRQNNYGR